MCCIRSILEPVLQATSKVQSGSTQDHSFLPLLPHVVSTLVKTVLNPVWKLAFSTLKC